MLGSKVTLWGTPADHSHDIQRCMAFFSTDSAFFPDDGSTPECQNDLFTRAFAPWKAPSAANVPVRAFVANPTACTPDGVGLETRLHVEGWAASRPFDDASFVSHLPPGLPLPVEDWGAVKGPDGCGRVPFDPSFGVKADTRKADSPAGLSVDSSFPQAGLVNPLGVSTGHLKRATVALPEGWSVSPSAADGLDGCLDAESRVGTLLRGGVSAGVEDRDGRGDTRLLEEKLTGGVFVGSQESDDPLSGQMFRMFIALNNEQRGIRVKLPGQIRIPPGGGPS